MRKNRGKIVSILLIILSIVLIGTGSNAHSGRTDANGGHRDNKNKSGLGSYHYHCGGHPAHLHPNGVCPYSSSSSSSKGSTSNSSSSKKSTSSGSSSNKGSTSSNSSPSKSNTSTSSSSSNSKPSTVDVTGIRIYGVNDIEVGESRNLTATIIPGNATNKTITWKSSDESIATVTSEGEIIAKKAGKVKITATCSNGKTSTIEISVKDVPETENNVISNYKNNNIINNEEDVIASNKDVLNPLGVIIALGLLGGGGYLVYKNYKKDK